MENKETNTCTSTFEQFNKKFLAFYFQLFIMIKPFILIFPYSQNSASYICGMIKS